MGRSDLSLQEVSDRLGVHYMTAYRYVRLGLLPATKQGSSWSITEADLRDFASSARGPRGDRRKGAPWAERLEARLVAGDLTGSWRVVEAAMGGGLSASGVYTELVAAAMRSIGRRWATGELDIADEHRASAVAAKLIGRLGHGMVRRGRPKGTIVIGTAAGERHGLVVSMAADLLRACGFEVVDLGCDLPAAAFAAATATTDGVVAVAVSATTAGGEVAAAETIASVKRARPDVPVFAGGEMVPDAAAASTLGADGWAASIDGFATALGLPAG